MNFFFLKFEIFTENHPPTRHIKYKKRDFVPCNKSIQPIWNDLEDWLNLCLRDNSANYIAG